MARFTSANAREMAARSVEARQERQSAGQTPLETPLEAEGTTDFVSVRLVRVRALLTDTDAQLAKAKDPLDRERLARAAQVLSEQERIMAGRPLPGAFRPSKARTAAAPSAEIV